MIILERFEDKEILVEKCKTRIEEELLIKIELLKEHLNELEMEIRFSLNKSIQNLNKNLSNYESKLKNELGCVREFLNDTSKFKNDTTQMKSTINKCELFNKNLKIYNLNLSNYLNELKFEPNNNLPNSSFVGNLNRVECDFVEEIESDDDGDETASNKVKIKGSCSSSELVSLNKINIINNNDDDTINFTTLKTTKIISMLNNAPISPRFLTKQRNSVFFTDNVSKTVVKLNTNNDDTTFMFKNMFKAPEGICFNAKNELYVSDYESNLIFKFNKNLEFVTKFGSKILNWPRGIACDDLENNLMLYVCDYWNQRCCVFNEHGQFNEEFGVGEDSAIAASTLDDGKFHPFNIQLSRLHIFVSDDWMAGNCIRMFNKTDKILLKNISNLLLYNPFGLLIDSINNHLYTIGHLYYENGLNYLFCFNYVENELVSKIELNSNCLISDFILDRRDFKIYCAAEKQLHIYGLA